MCKLKKRISKEAQILQLAHIFLRLSSQTVFDAPTRFYRVAPSFRQFIDATVFGKTIRQRAASLCTILQYRPVFAWFCCIAGTLVCNPKMEFQAVILAAGQGSRISDLTSSVPKALLPIANMPMIWYPVQMLEKAGFQEALVVVLESTRADIEKALVEICDVKIKLDFVAIPNSQDWGTADTLRHIRDRIKTDLMLVSCDLITDVSLHLLADLHRTYDSTITMLLAPSVDITDVSVPGGKANRKIERDIVGLDTAGNRLLFLSSEADIEDVIPLKRRFLKDLLTEESSISTIKGELMPHLVRKQFSHKVVKQDNSSGEMSKKEFGDSSENDFTNLALEMSVWNSHKDNVHDCSHDDDIRCFAYIMDGGMCIRTNTLVTYCEANRQAGQLIQQKNIHSMANIHQKSQVGSDSLVGDGSTVAERVSVKHSVIGRHCTIGDKCRITNCVIMNYVTIKEGCTLSGCIVCDHAHIDEKSELKDCLIGNSQSIQPMSKCTNEVIVELDRMMEII
ncbi:Translation initiation factor eIF-2B subunit gamma [Lamellibrachia satsuma]|nr:Translation initiation factor eIF-2B subunit gamma [Lamellibrachia satsuma]